MSLSVADRRIRSLRPAKLVVDPSTAQGSLLEDERRPDGRVERALTVFLTGAECAFTCSFCDLWRSTIDGPTPRGALTAQLKKVLEKLGEEVPDRLKLYNSSNFFDPRAVPPEDVLGIAKLVAPFPAITVESHASTIGPRALRFAREIPGRLEVALGLETIHPAASAALNKRLDLARFDSAAGFLSENGIDLRAFVLLGAPYVRVEESVDWTVRTVKHAIECGAAVVSIIPVRAGNGEIERLQALGHFTLPTLSQLEAALDACLALTPAVVTADLWDIERLATCESCRSARIERLRRLNITGRMEPRIACDKCQAA